MTHGMVLFDRDGIGPLRNNTFRLNSNSFPRESTDTIKWSVDHKSQLISLSFFPSLFDNSNATLAAWTSAQIGWTNVKAVLGFYQPQNASMSNVDPVTAAGSWSTIASSLNSTKKVGGPVMGQDTVSGGALNASTTWMSVSGMPLKTFSCFQVIMTYTFTSDHRASPAPVPTPLPNAASTSSLSLSTTPIHKLSISSRTSALTTINSARLSIFPFGSWRLGARIS